ncbi:MAG: BsuPI-related putative proteinase inhibitor [Candidatus Aureabacteria bacterium]|nr:BsuPI-related putative proteinase inhibitor [Candidatus Auribacterota bacterium]
MLRPSVEVRLTTDKDIYLPDEPVHISVSAFNGSPADLLLTFPSGYQVDYTIDGAYRWSDGMTFIDSPTQVTVPAEGTYSWPAFTHAPSDYSLAPGSHTIIGEVVGYGRTARIIEVASAVTPTPTPRPGLQLGLTMDPPANGRAGLRLSCTIVPGLAPTADVALGIVDATGGVMAFNQSLQSLKTVTSLRRVERIARSLPFDSPARYELPFSTSSDMTDGQYRFIACVFAHGLNEVLQTSLSEPIRY